MACSSSAAASRAAEPVGAASGSSLPGKAATVNDDAEGLARSEKFFGTSPVRLVDDVYNVTSVYMKRGLDQLETEMQEDPYTQKEPLAIKQGVSQAYEKLFSSLDKNVDKFEIYVVRNILKMPRHLDLSASAISAAANGPTVTKEEEDQMDADLEALRRKIHAEYVNRAMATKVKDLQEHITNIETVNAVFEQMDQKLSEQSLPPLEATVSEVLYKEPEIRALEKQYSALDAERTKENTPMDLDGQALETQFTRCKAQIGGTSTRNMDQLGTLLGAR